MANSFIPVIDRALVEYLSTVYPDKCPNMRDSDREVWFKAGQNSVVSHLLYLLQEQEGSILSPNHNL